MEVGGALSVRRQGLAETGTCWCDSLAKERVVRLSGATGAGTLMGADKQCQSQAHYPASFAAFSWFMAAHLLMDVCPAHPRAS